MTAAYNRLSVHKNTIHETNCNQNAHNNTHNQDDTNAAAIIVIVAVAGSGRDLYDCGPDGVVRAAEIHFKRVAPERLGGLQEHDIRNIAGVRGDWRSGASLMKRQGK